MVFMSVRNKKSFYFLDILFQIRNIGNYQIDAQHIVFRKRQSAVYYDNVVFVFKRSNIHSDLLKPSQRNDL